MMFGDDIIFAGADDGIVSHDIRLEALPQHLRQQLRRLLPLLPFLQALMTA